MSDVLVTGAGGFIGRHVVGRLLSRGHRAILTTSGDPRRLRRVFPQDNVTVEACDLLDSRSVSELIRRLRPDRLLHLAWYTEHGKFWSAPINNDWESASRHLIREFADNGGRRVVAAGTCAEYDWNDGFCDELRTPLQPETLYGVCKARLYRTFESLLSDYGLSGAWGRIFLLYGPNEQPGRLIPSILQALFAGRPVRCTHGRQLRDFLHVEDVASAFAALLESDVAGPVNIGSATPVTIGHVVQELVRQSGVASAQIEWGAIPDRPGDPPTLVPETRRLRLEVEWTPRFDLAAGLGDVVEHWRRHSASDRAA